MDEQLNKSRILIEGKTKVVRTSENPNRVVIFQKDDITAGDGARHDTLTGKGVWCNQTSVNCFGHLKDHGVPTHFIREFGLTGMIAHRVDMIPLEVVIRRLATGSYCKRHLRVAQGTRFEVLLPEFYFKDDANHDPMVVYDHVSQTWDMYVASKPLVEGFLRELPAVVTRGGRTVSGEDVQKLGNLAIAVFCILEVALYELEIVLWDMKIECGYDVATGEILVADDITNDSWRIRFRDEQEFKDKQVYRDLAKVTDGDLEKLAENYAWVAEQTSHFAFKHPIRTD